MGNVVKALTRVASKSNAGIEEVPSSRKAASVTATPVKAAGPNDATGSKPDSNTEQSSTAKRAAAEERASGVKNENTQNLPGYMRPLNR